MPSNQKKIFDDLEKKIQAGNLDVNMLSMLESIKNMSPEDAQKTLERIKTIKSDDPASFETDIIQALYKQIRGQALDVLSSNPAEDMEKNNPKDQLPSKEGIVNEQQNLKSDTLPESLMFLSEYIAQAIAGAFNPSALVRDLEDLDLDPKDIPVDDQKRFVRWIANQEEYYNKINELNFLFTSFKPYHPDSLQDFLDVYLDHTNSKNAGLLAGMFVRNIRSDNKIDEQEASLIVEIVEYLINKVKTINEKEIRNAEYIREKIQYRAYLNEIHLLVVTYNKNNTQERLFEYDFCEKLMKSTTL
jgi:hypothetical protein